jgi:cell division protein FtsB
MGWLCRRKDPLARRHEELRRQIAALEAQIQQLTALANQAPSSGQPSVGGTPGPRLRSTTFPHGPTVAESKAASPPVQEPVFEEVNPFKAPPESPARNSRADLGLGQGGLVAAWERLKTHLRGPTPSNPKLVSYLAAGSIQGLRPLRYERRVARNRFLVLALLLVLVLLGFFYVFLNPR